MNPLSAALNRARSSLDNVDRLLENDARRHHSDLIEEPIVHEPEASEPQQESEAVSQSEFANSDFANVDTTIHTHPETTDDRLRDSELHAPSPIREEQSMQPIKKVGLLCGREYSF